MKKKCKRCGKEFEPQSSHQLYCNQIRKSICSICGKEFEFRCEKDAVMNKCSKCKNLYKKQCKVCGNDFITSSPGKQICDGIHYKTCPVCSKEFIADNKRLYEDYCCSKECANKRRNQAISDVLKMKPVGYNKPKTLYHKVCAFCGKEFDTHQLNKIYCDDKHFKTCVICGTEFEISKDNLYNSAQVCSEVCRQELIIRNKLSKEDADTWSAFVSGPSQWIKNNFDHSPTYYELSQSLPMAISTIQQRLKSAGCEYLVDRYVSTMEQEVIDFIHALDSDIVIEHNNRTIIKPQEIDIYLPEYHVGIECNPTISHNSSKRQWARGFEGVNPSYHRKESEAAEAQGVFLFHLFSYEWIHKNEIMKSMIRNLLHKNERTIYARKCKIREVNNTDTFSFLIDNHRQGYAKSDVSIGLYYEDELVSLMTFVPSRKTIGERDGSWELLRFCSKMNTSVAGGASKLFKYFVDNSTVDNIISFSDTARTRGDLYQTLGFQYIHLSDPGYVWVKLNSDKAYNRVNAQKSNIRHFLKDDTIDLNLSESEIMEAHQYLRVYDCGTKLWEWNRYMT